LLEILHCKNHTIFENDIF